MACKYLFIEVGELKEYVDISPNLLPRITDSIIQLSQETFYKQNVLCPDYYDELTSEVEAGTVTASNQLVINKIKPALAQRVFIRILQKGGNISTASGFRVHNEDNSNASERTQLADLIEQARRDADYYDGDLLLFLEQNKTDYPTWEASDCNECRNNNTGQFNITGAGKKRVRYAKHPTRYREQDNY